MSVSPLPNKVFTLAEPNQAGNSQQTNAKRSGASATTASDSPGSFAASLALSMAGFQSQTFGSLLGSVFGNDKSTAASGLDALLGSQGSAGASNPLAALTGGSGISGLSATGRNSALFDPESGYRMMSVINQADVTFKAQFSELSEMKSEIAEMQQDAQSLGGVSQSTDNAGITSALQKFVGQYNDWVKEFDADMQNGGVLAGTQAAQISRYELDQSIKNPFNGAADGLRGLRDLGFSIDPQTNLASLDTGKLDAVLASNKQGAVDTVQEFAANFAKSAELLNSANNFIPNQLNNLSRAIDYIDSNQSSLQAEFGTGDAAQTSDPVAQALAAYNRMHTG